MKALILFALAIHLRLMRGHLILQPPPEDRSQKLKFGQTTCISPDGRRIAVGANGYDRYKGAVYIYELATGTGERIEHWRRQRLSGNDTQAAEEKKSKELRMLARGSGFGFACDMTSDRIVVGAPGDHMQRGAIYVFDGVNEVDKISVSDGRSGDAFGWSVAVSEMCTTVAVSAKGRRANNGEVYVYKCERGCMGCKLGHRLVPPDYTDSAGPRGIRIRNNFGISLDMNGAGDVIAVGCTGFENEKGAVYVFSYDVEEDKWEMVQRLESPNAQQYGFFGYKLSMDKRGEKIAVGADGEDDYKGAAYLFERVKTKKKNEMKYEEVQQLRSDERRHEDNFGGSIAISGDGRAVVVGAPGANRGGYKDHGVLYVYEEMMGKKESAWEVSDTVWLPRAHAQHGLFFGWNVGISDSADRFAASAPESYSGAGLAAFGILHVTGRSKPDSGSLVHDDVVDFDKQEL